MRENRLVKIAKEFYLNGVKDEELKKMMNGIILCLVKGKLKKVEQVQ